MGDDDDVLAVAEKPKAEVEQEDRIDEFAISMFGHLGYKGRLPDTLVQLYKDYKRTKDRLTPGRLTAEGFATIVTLHSLVN